MSEMRWVIVALLWASFMKNFFGFHWPWETCDCCHKKYRDHKK